MQKIIYRICLAAFVAAAISSCKDKDEALIINPPNAAFTADKTAYFIGDEVRLTNQSTPSDAPIVEYFWHFGFEGNGSYSQEQNPTITYSKSGKYAVKLTVTDQKGVYATMVDTIEVLPVNRPPVAAFSYSPATVAVNGTVNFSNQSTDADGTVESFAWDFGNGQTSSEPNPSTAYTSAGFYSVSLTVTDNRGDADTKTTSIFVRSAIVAFGTTLWTTTYENASAIEATSPSVGDNGDIYVTSNAMKLHAVSPAGNIKWSFDLTQEGTSAGKQTSSPIVGTDGVVYIGAGYNHSAEIPAKAGYFAVNPADGSKKWWFAFPDVGSRVYYTPPAIAIDGNIIIANRGTNGRIRKLNKETGAPVWVAQPHGGGPNGVTVISKEGTVYSVASSVRGIARISDEGTNLGGLSDNAYYMSGVHCAIDADGTLYAASESGTSANGGSAGAVIAYKPDGTVKWEVGGYAKFDYSGVAIAPDGASIYIGNSTGASSKLIALNKSNGSEKWTYATDASIQSAPAVDVNGIIHFADANGNYYALNPDGTQKLKKSIGTKVWSSPVIADYGVLYFTVEEGGACKLVAIEINAGPANSPWPQAGQNARRDGLQK
jgi:PKD repeat protein